MNKTNPIFEALNELPENYAAEAVTSDKKKTKKPLKIVMIAATAAIAALCVGFMATGDPRYELRAGSGNKITSTYLRVKEKKIDLPEDYQFEDDKGPLPDQKFAVIEKKPSEVFKELGLNMLISDKFSEDIDFSLEEYYDVDKGLTFTSGNSYPRVVKDGNTVSIGYSLYYKELDRQVLIGATYITRHFESYGSGYDMGEYEFVKLKDGSDCLVDRFGANFAYDGGIYSIEFHTDRNGVGIDTVKQTLADLGLYDYNG